MPKRKADTALPDTGGYVLEDQIGYLLRRAHQRASSIFQDIMSNELTPPQYAALVKIGAFGTVSQNQLGRAVAMDPATSQGVVQRLLAKKLVRRAADPGDKRRTMLSLTPEGKALVERLVPLGAQVTEATLAPLEDADRARLLDFLKRLG